MNVRKWVVAALLAALMGVFEILQIGIIPIPPVGATIYHVPVLIGVMLEGLGVGLALGGWFGILSMISAYTRPVSPLNLCFQNPLVAVLPRLLIPLAVWAVQKLVCRLWPKRKTLGIAVSAAVGSLTNTVFVLSAVMLFYGPFVAQTLDIQLSGLLGWAAGLGLVQGLPEAAVAMLLCMAVVPILRTIYKPKGSKQ